MILLFFTRIAKDNTDNFTYKTCYNNEVVID
jgi:hypothetical protein